MKKPLEGLVVLDFTRYEAGPLATYLLAHLGAYVIKVEKSYVGEDERMYPPFYNGESLAFPCYNLNKHSLCMELRNDKSKELLKRLLPHVDVVTQNFRAGTIEKMGFDWETLHSINPRLIMANNSGFGQTGPYHNRLAFDSIIQSESGLINSVAEASGGTPYYPGGNNSDHLGALCFANAILAAVNQRDRTGEGQYLEVDMMSAITSMFSPELSLFGATGKRMQINDLAPCACYTCRGGEMLQLSCPAERWDALRALAALPALEGPKFSTLDGRIAHKAELDGILGEWTSGQEAETLRVRLEENGIGAGIVKNYKDIWNTDHIQKSCYRKVEVPYVGEVPLPELPFTMSGFAYDFNRAPKIGEHNTEILHRFLDMSDAEITALTEEGVLYKAEHACWKPA